MATTKRESASARRERLEKMRREQQAHERRRNLIGVGVLVIILVLLVVGVYFGTRGHHTTTVSAKNQVIPAGVPAATKPCTASTKDTATCVTVQPAPKKVANSSGISGVIAYDTEGWPGDGKSHPGALGHDHVLGPVKYVVTPPVGGPHNPVWMNAGVYTKPIPVERAVHNLEHGAIWITYDSNLPKSQVQQLTDFVTKQSMIDEANDNGNANRYMDLSPWPGKLPSPIVMSAWGYQLQLTSPTDSRMQKFVDTFRHNSKYTPEFGAAVDGIPVQTGGVPATDGSKFANPSGKVNGQGM